MASATEHFHIDSAPCIGRRKRPSVRAAWWGFGTTYFAMQPPSISSAVPVTKSELAACAKATTGGVDALINNAALYGGLERRDFIEIEESVRDDVMSINVKGVWQMTRSISP